MVTLEGLTQEQVDMCNKLWKLETQQDFDELINSLKNPEREMAFTLMQIIIQESSEEFINDKNISKEVNNLINRCKP